MCDYGLIVKDDAAVASHSHYKPVAVGGTLTDLTPGASGTIGGLSYVGSLNQFVSNNFQFTLGVRYGASPIDWGHLEYLAITLQPLAHGPQQVRHANLCALSPFLRPPVHEQPLRDLLCAELHTFLVDDQCPCLPLLTSHAYALHRCMLSAVVAPTALGTSAATARTDTTLQAAPTS